MTRNILLALLSTVCLSVMAGPASAQQPNFGPALYADGALWGTKGTTNLPAPNAHNVQSFDKLFVIVNGAPGQLPVAEAAPGNPLYNGGRWFTHTVMWTTEGMNANNPLPVLMSYGDIQLHYNLGDLAIAPGSPAGGPSDYFQCPLLPVK
ncbi:MAG: hypothetical protein MUO39_11950 [Steroidobacteraceae bacterium]|nr:hypothetical protein [Steroidobacteraceae bacterium]